MVNILLIKVPFWGTFFCLRHSCKTSEILFKQSPSQQLRCVEQACERLLPQTSDSRRRGDRTSGGSLFARGVINVQRTLRKNRWFEFSDVCEPCCQHICPVLRFERCRSHDRSAVAGQICEGVILKSPLDAWPISCGDRTAGHCQWIVWGSLHDAAGKKLGPKKDYDAG